MKRIALLALAPFAMMACQAKTPAAEQPAASAEMSSQPGTNMPANAPMADPNSPEGKIASAESAAPPAIAAGATIMDMGADMKLVELRKGTNGWTCLPNLPSTPGPDPMCLDQNAMGWVGAWLGHTTPKMDSDGLAYMLQGGSDPSNDDPFAEAPPTGADWVNTPPHIMVLPVNPKTLDKMSNDPKAGGPFVMFRGTPYAHIMMPVAAK